MIHSTLGVAQRRTKKTVEVKNHRHFLRGRQLNHHDPLLVAHGMPKGV